MVDFRLEKFNNSVKKIVGDYLSKDFVGVEKIIKRYLPLMNQQINKYLQLMDFYINFSLDDEFKAVSYTHLTLPTNREV